MSNDPRADLSLSVFSPVFIDGRWKTYILYNSWIVLIIYGALGFFL
jgi:hypothetical protein